MKDEETVDKGYGITACPNCDTHFKNGKALPDADKALAEARAEEAARKKAEEEAAIEASHQGLA